MNNIKRIVFILGVFIFSLGESQAQDEGNFSGSLELNANVFIRDTAIGAANTPQYDNQLSGGEAWLNLNYSIKGFDFALRFDAFHNSNLLNPLDSYSAHGIGYWQIRKKVDKLDITAGHIYDQIGSGIIFRSYEQRPLAIDNALVGIRLMYDINDFWQLKAFTGRQRRPFSANREELIARAYSPIIKGGSLEGYIENDEEAETYISLAPGIGIVNRTLDDNSMNQIVANINTYTEIDSFIPKFNVYAFSAYNTLTVGDFSWYIEGAYKTHEAIFDPFAIRTNPDGSKELGKLVDEDGYVLYTNLNYTRGDIGISLEVKRTENFNFRTSPLETLFNGMVNFLPPMARQNTYRLTARYNAATQELGEMAYQADIRYAPNRKMNFLANFSNITDLNNELLYREVFTQANFRKPRVWSLTTGVQFQQYNQERFEEKPGVPIVTTIIPYADFTYKIDKEKSIRIEGQYMYTEEDFGQWVFALAEFSIAPHWIFTVSDMINVKPAKSDKIEHYYSAAVAYSHNSNRFSLAYVRQVEGVVCTGGICRFEPAFSGVRFSATSSF